MCHLFKEILSLTTCEEMTVIKNFLSTSLIILLFMTTEANTVWFMLDLFHLLQNKKNCTE